MKYIKNLKPILLTNFHGENFKDEKGEPAKMTLKMFILEKLADPKFGRDMEAITSAFQLKKALTDAGDNPGYFAVETKDWEVLSSVVKTPSAQNHYNPVLSHCLIPFMKAVTEAVDTVEDSIHGQTETVEKENKE